MFREPDSAADTSSPHRMPAVFCSSSVFPFESMLREKYQVEAIFLVSVFQDAAWPRSIPRTEAVKQRNPYRLISSMRLIAALATSHAVTRMNTNQNKTTRNRRAEHCTQGAASDSTSSPSAHAQLQHRAPPSLEHTLQEKALPSTADPGSCPNHGSDGGRLQMGLVTQLLPKRPDPRTGITHHSLCPASQYYGMLNLKPETQLNGSTIPLGDRMGQSRVL